VHNRTGKERFSGKPMLKLPRAAHSGFRLRLPLSLRFAHAVRAAQLQPLGHLSGAGWETHASAEHLSSVRSFIIANRAALRADGGLRL
jgi:hypothetical protein